MDYTNLPVGRRKTSALPRMMMAGFIVFLMAAAGFVFYEYKTHPAWSAKLAAYRENVSNWLAERKQSMHHGIAKVRTQAAGNSEEDRPVNFEFYNTLQDMKAMSVDARAAVQKKTNEAVQVAKKSQSAKISHAADLEKDLLAAMKKNSGGE